MRTDGGFKKLPEKQHERKKKRRAGRNRRLGERERKSEKGEEMDGRVGSQERERESERRMVNEKKGPALHHNYRPKIPKNSCQTE